MYEIINPASPLINTLWHAVAQQDDMYTDAANEYWSIGFARHTDGSFSADVFGPSLLPRLLDGRKGEEYWGIEFKAHITTTAIRKKHVLNTSIALSVVNDQFIIGGHKYSIPTYNELEPFAVQLEKDGVIINNQQIYRAMHGNESGFSERSRQRHFVSSTGLTKKQIEQLKRARQAFYLLQEGGTPSEVAHLTGYADQSHMTRALKLLRGETPAQIIATHLR